MRKWKNDVRKLQSIIEQLKGREVRKKSTLTSATEREPFSETTNLFDQNNDNNNNLIQQLQQKIKRLTEANCALKEANKSLEEQKSVSNSTEFRLK